jgi:hypothetical protein
VDKEFNTSRFHVNIGSCTNFYLCDTTDQRPKSRLQIEWVGANTEVHFEGRIDEVSVLAQLLCWIAATFRIPEAKYVRCSSVSFRYSHASSFLRGFKRRSAPTSEQSSEPSVFKINLNNMKTFDREHGRASSRIPLFPQAPPRAPADDLGSLATG